MDKQHLILVNGKLWDRKLTRAGAMKQVMWLRLEKGMNAAYAYELENGTFEPITH